MMSLLICLKNISLLGHNLNSCFYYQITICEMVLLEIPRLLVNCSHFLTDHRYQSLFHRNDVRCSIHYSFCGYKLDMFDLRTKITLLVNMSSASDISKEKIYKNIFNFTKYNFNIWCPRRL